MKFAWVLSIFGFCVACGIKGPPLPPLKDEVIRKQKGESVTVATPAPFASSTDSTKATPTQDKKKNKQ